MRKIVAGFAASVDGYIEGLHGEIDWILVDKEIDFTQQMKRYDVFLYGRRTYEMVLPMGNKLTPGAAHYVFSNTLSEVAENFALIKGDIRTRVQHLKKQPGKDIAVFGGAILLASLLDLQLVDEMVISVIPVLLGSGKPMVAALKEKAWLAYRASKPYGNGTVQLTYDVVYNRR